MDLVSCGIIPCRNLNRTPEFFLVCHKNGGHWGFPKGKQEKGETYLDAAKRELKEETGLSIERLLSSSPLEESYRCVFNGKAIKKIVFYYVAIVQGENFFQQEELLDGQWYAAEAAMERITFPESKRLFSKALSLLSLSVPPL